MGELDYASENRDFDDEDEEIAPIADYVVRQIREIVRQVLVENGLIDSAAEDE